MHPDITIYKERYIISIRLCASSSRDVRNPKEYAISQVSTYKIDAKMCTLHNSEQKKVSEKRDTEVLEVYFPHTKQNSGNSCFCSVIQLLYGPFLQFTLVLMTLFFDFLAP